MIKTLGTLMIGGLAGWHLARSKNAYDVAAVFSDKDIYKVGYEVGIKNSKREFAEVVAKQFVAIFTAGGGRRESDEEILNFISEELDRDEE